MDRLADVNLAPPPAPSRPVQLWPLNRATWELGPHFPFDNGPTGLNTLVAPHFVTSSGFLLMADPATPFLHVGMNTPLRDTFKVRLLWYFLIPLAGSKRGISPGAAGGAGAVALVVLPSRAHSLCGALRLSGEVGSPTVST